MTKTLPRNAYFDFLRGIAILMVVGIHTYSGYSFDTFSGNVSIIVRQMLNTAVPLFLALSAYFLCRKPLNTWEERTTFWKKQIPKVYVPCIIWSIPFLLIAILQGGNITKALIIFFLCGFSIYYFIALIIQYYLLLPWFQPFGKKLMIGSAVVSLISILTVSYITAIKGISVPLIVYAVPFPVWIAFFVMGGVIHCNTMCYNIFIPVCVVVLGIVLSYMETKYLVSFHGVGYGIKLSAFIYSAGAIMLLLDKRIEETYCGSSIVCRVMEYIGRISFGIYLTHMLIKMVYDRIFAFDSWFLDWAFVTLLTISFIVVSRKILSSKVLKYIGFQ